MAAFSMRYPALEGSAAVRSEEHTSELQSRQYLVCRLLLEKKKKLEAGRGAPHVLSHLIRVVQRFRPTSADLSLRLVGDFFFFFFNDTATTEIYTLSLHDALPICSSGGRTVSSGGGQSRQQPRRNNRSEEHTSELQSRQYLVCRLLLEKKKKN